MEVNESSKAEKLRSLEYSRLLRPWLGFGLGASSTNGLDEDGGGVIVPLIEEQSNYLLLSHDSVPSILYRSVLFETADGIVDICPLESGYAWDMLGRLSFGATWSGQGWWGVNGGGGDGGVISYPGVGMLQRRMRELLEHIYMRELQDDSGVRVMRLRSR